MSGFIQKCQLNLNMVSDSLKFYVLMLENMYYIKIK